MASINKISPIGDSLDDFLKENEILEEVTAAALKSTIAWQLSQEIKKQRITKTEMAKRMGTSRSQLNRILSEEDTGISIENVFKAARVLGKTVKFQLV